MDYKQKFIEYYQANIHREGADRLLEWLQTTDFFTAPASTRYHCACPSGLVQHSVNVYEVMMEKHFDPETDSAESFALCALLHDVCKANYYHRDSDGWTVRDALPMGHGEKSVYLIQKYMDLTDEEALAIRWHMGAYDEDFRGGSRALGEAQDRCALVLALHQADMRATQEEKRREGL